MTSLWPVRPLALVAVAVSVPLVAAACGSSGAAGGGSGGAAGAVAKAPASLCLTLTGVFSDGPDPDADPVGYALSQIKPLGGIHTSFGTVGSTLHALIAADQALVDSNGSDKAATKAIGKADASLNKACPGVAS